MRMRKTRRGIIAAMVMALALLAGESSGRVIYVDAKGPAGGTGVSWANAFPCVQTALGVAEKGDVIRVAQGTYRPDEGIMGSRRVELKGSGDRTATFLLVTGAAMRGGYAGLGGPDPNARDVHKYETILTGDLKGNDVDLAGIDWEAVNAFTLHASRTDNSYCVVTIEAGDSGTVLDGFTITGGHVLWGTTSTGMLMGGSGMTVSAGTPTIVDCTFRRNTARAEGVGGYGAWGFRGGAVVSANSQPTFQRCTFIENILSKISSGLGSLTVPTNSMTSFLSILNTVGIGPPSARCCE